MFVRMWYVCMYVCMYLGMHVAGSEGVRGEAGKRGIEIGLCLSLLCVRIEGYL